MNKLLVISLASCSGSIAAILATGTSANTDAVKAIPYPEVMNLSRVPTFNAQGMVPPANIAGNILKRAPQQIARDPLTPTRLARATPAVPIAVDLASEIMPESTPDQHRGDCASCRNLAPSVMMLGYSTEGASSRYGKMY